MPSLSLRSFSLQWQLEVVETKVTVPDAECIKSNFAFHPFYRQESSYISAVITTVVVRIKTVINLQRND